MKTFLGFITCIRIHAAVQPILLIAVIIVIARWIPVGKATNVLTVFFIGALGGATSVYYRLKDFPLDKQAALTLKDSLTACLQVYTSSFVGGIFAFVLFTALISKIVAGSLFPVFATDQEAFFYIDVLAYHTAKSNVDTGKLLLWCFIAGFIERLVPNIIDKMVKDREGNKK